MPRAFALSRFRGPLLVLLAIACLAGDAAAQCGPGGCPSPSFGRRIIAPRVGESPEYPRGTQPGVQPLAPPEQVPAAVRDLRPAIVRIWNYGSGGVRFGGTGVYVGNGRVLTCLHTFRPEGRWIYTRIEILWPGGQKTAAAIVDYKGEHDLCMLRVDSPPDAPAVEVAESEPQIGETLYWAGYSGGDEIDVGIGRATSVGANIQMTTAPRLGDSGGPILNAAGKLVGVVIAKDCWNTTCYGTHLVRLRSLFFPRPASPGPVRKIIPKLLPEACKPRPPAAPPAPLPTPAPPDPRIGEAAETLRSIDGRVAELQGRGQSIDENVGRIEGYLRPQEGGLKPGLVILAVLAAAAIGGVLFYATQRHSPLA